MLKKRARRRCARCSIPDDHSAQILLTKHIAATGGVDRASVALSAAGAAPGDERVEHDEEVDLGVCDRAPRLLEGGGGHAADELGA